MEDDDIDYDAENYDNDEPIEEGDDLVDEIENCFINANASDNPVESYLNVIELETQNSEKRIFTFRSYKEICKIYLKENSYYSFSEYFNKLMETSKRLTAQAVGLFSFHNAIFSIFAGY